MSNWGSKVVLACLDDPLTRRAYEYVFTDCQELRWYLDESGGPLPAKEADIIGFNLGQNGNREPAVLTTDLFELSVKYGRLEVRALTSDSDQARRPFAAAGD